jgi:hypothetical protein
VRLVPASIWCAVANLADLLENHVKTMVSVAFFTMSTIRCQVLYVFLVLAHGRRRIVHFNVTRHPTAEWTLHNYGRPSRLTRSLDTCYAIGTPSSAVISRKV